VEGILNSFPARVIQKYLEDRAQNWVILIAWNALFAMFPMMIFIASILGLVLSSMGLKSREIYNNLVAAIPDEGARKEVIEALNGVQQQKGLLFIVGLLGLLWGGSALFGAMEQAFAVIYHSKPRDFVSQKLMSFGMVFLFVVLAGLAVGSSSLLPALNHIPYVPSFLTSGAAAFLIQVAIGALSGTILFGSIYYVVPNRRQQLRRVVPGAVVAGVMFELISLLFPAYLSLNKGINAYGATFGLFFVLLTFFFLMGLITMAGIEVNSVLYPEPAPPRRRGAFAFGPKADEVASRRGAGPEQVTSAQTNGSQPARRGVRARTAVILAVAASLAGVLLGRRSAGSD
jgi:membrane protein